MAKCPECNGCVERKERDKFITRWYCKFCKRNWWYDYENHKWMETKDGTT